MTPPARIEPNEPFKRAVLDKLNEIIDYLAATRLQVAGEGAVLRDHASGQVLDLSGWFPPAPVSDYAGIFKAVLAPGEDEEGNPVQLIRVVDGRDGENEVCGTVRLRNSDAPGLAAIRIPVAVSEFPVDPAWTASQLVLLVVAWDTELGQYTAVIEPRQSLTPATGEFVYPIAYYFPTQGWLSQEFDAGPHVDDFDLSQLVWS